MAAFSLGLMVGVGATLAGFVAYTLVDLILTELSMFEEAV